MPANTAPAATVRAYFADGSVLEWRDVPATQVDAVWQVSDVQCNDARTSNQVSYITTEITKLVKKRVQILEPLTEYKGARVTASDYEAHYTRIG